MSGRRRQRTGGVTVAELVDRQQPAPAATGSVKTQLSASNDHGAPVTEAEPTTDTPERGTSAMAGAGRIAGLAVGVLAVLAAVAAAWTIQGKQGDQTPIATQRLEITGVDALRPDRLAARLSDRSTGSATDRHEHGARPTGSPNTTTPNTVTPNTVTPNTTTPNTTTRLTGHGSHDWMRSQDAVTSGSVTVPEVTGERQPSPEDVVRRFYQLLITDSDQAVQLLDPKLVGSDVEVLGRSWSGTSKVAVEQVTASGDGMVIAVVRIPRPDGSWLRVRQLFSTTDGKPPRISSVRLLSAQRG